MPHEYKYSDFSRKIVPGLPFLRISAKSEVKKKWGRGPDKQLWQESEQMWEEQLAAGFTDSESEGVRLLSASNSAQLDPAWLVWFVLMYRCPYVNSS